MYATASHLAADGSNAKGIADALDHIVNASKVGIDLCMRILAVHDRQHTQVTEGLLAVWLRNPEVKVPERYFVRVLVPVLQLCLDDKLDPPKGSLAAASEHLAKRYHELVSEAHRLEALRRALNARDPGAASKALTKLGIEAPSLSDDLMSSLPALLFDVIEKITDTEVEMLFPLTHFSTFKRSVLGSANAQGLLLRLVLRSGDSPFQFCIHLKGENVPHEGKHRKWLVGDGRRAPHEHFCFGEANRMIFQLARTVFFHLKENFESIEQTYLMLKAKIDILADACIVCGRSHGVSLCRPSVCSSTPCRAIMAQAHPQVRFGAITEDHAVVAVLLTAMNAAAKSLRVDLLLPGCFTKDAAEVTSRIEDLIMFLRASSDSQHFDPGARLPALLSASNSESSEMSPLRASLDWAWNSHGGFLASATGNLKIPSMPEAHQFLLANASPEVERAFNANIDPQQRSSTRVLFHGTSFDRLYAILSQGLKILTSTSLQRHGGAHGTGIYLAEEPSVASGYANVGGAGWIDSPFKNCEVILGCEYAGDDRAIMAPGIYVVTDTSRVIVRHVFLTPTGMQMPERRHVEPAMMSVYNSLRSRAY